MKRYALPSALCAALLTAALGLIAQSSYPVGITLTPIAPNGQVFPGATVSIPLSISSTTPPAGVQFDVAIPPEISAISATVGTAATAVGKSIACNQTAATLRCLINGMNATTVANGVVANIQATVSPTTASSAATINFSNALGASPTGTGQGVAPITGATFPIAQAASLSVVSLSCTPASLLSAGTSTCTVTLSGSATGLSPAPVVQLTSDNSTLAVPASLTIGTGSTGTFTASAGTITTAATAHVTATLNSSSQSAALALILPAISKCDLNGDGKTDEVDVALQQAQVLGTAACTSGDLNGDGKCNVVDAQNLILAVLGQGCRTTF